MTTVAKTVRATSEDEFYVESGATLSGAEFGRLAVLTLPRACPPQAEKTAEALAKELAKWEEKCAGSVFVLYGASVAEAVAITSNEMTDDFGPDQTVARGVVAVVHTRRRLFEEEVELRMADLPRRRPQVRLNLSRLPDNDE